MFAPLQGETGNKIIEQHNIDTSKIDSILLYTPEKGIDYKSTAALKIANQLGFPQNLSEKQYSDYRNLRTRFLYARNSSPYICSNHGSSKMGASR